MIKNTTTKSKKIAKIPRLRQKHCPMLHRNDESDYKNDFRIGFKKFIIFRTMMTLYGSMAFRPVIFSV